MALTNTTKTGVFLQAGGVLPIAPANFIETTSPVLITPTIATATFKRISGKLNTSDSYADVCNAQSTMALEHYMRSNDLGGTALDTAPEYGELLKICGFTETVDAGVGVTYTNTQTPELGSGVVYVDGNRFDFTGSLASDFVMTLQVGTPAMITANLQGYIDDAKPTQEVQPAVVDNDEPLMVVSCANLVTLGGTVLKPDRVTFSTNPEIADFYTMGGANGLKAKAMTDYALLCTIDFFVDNEDYDREIIAIEDQTTATLEVDIATDENSLLVNGKSMKVSCDLVKTENYADTDSNNALKRSVTYRLQNNASDVAISILLGTFA